VCLPVQVLLSGGVDSTVCTALLNKALNPDQVIAVHIDNGFMRKRESQSVEEALTKLGIKLHGEPCYMAIWLYGRTSGFLLVIPRCHPHTRTLFMRWTAVFPTQGDTPPAPEPAGVMFEATRRCQGWIYCNATC